MAHELDHLEQEQEGAHIATVLNALDKRIPDAGNGITLLGPDGQVVHHELTLEALRELNGAQAEFANYAGCPPQDVEPVFRQGEFKGFQIKPRSQRHQPRSQ